MEVYLNQAVKYINDLYQLMAPEYWYGLVAGLVVILAGLKIVQRRKKVTRRQPQIEAKKDLFARKGFIDEEEDQEEALDFDKTTDVQLPVDAEAGVFELDQDEGHAPAEEEDVFEGSEEVTDLHLEIPEPEVEPEPVAAPKISFFDRLKNGLSKTRNSFSEGLNSIFSGDKKLDDDLLEDLEELLITSDVGVKTSMSLIERLSTSEAKTAEEVKQALKQEILSIVSNQKVTAENTQKPHVIMVIGVNGVGKTTTIGKLAAKYAAQGKKVLVAAADTFRAAAAEQLTIWAERANADIVKHKENADPAAVAYDGVEAAIARGVDIVLIDTAGRLHTKVNLMEELKKIGRSVAKKLPEAPHEIIMVLDATTGQNAMSQARIFHEAMNVTGLVLTKLDGTAKGGIVISICDEFKIPLKYIGVGEQTEDLQTFDAHQFVEALF